MRIETPRLLFNSACPGHSHGLANSSGTLGKYLMAQAGNVVAGRFGDLIRLYKAPPRHALSEEFYETDPQRGFARGFAIQTVGPLPIAFCKADGGGDGRVGLGHAPGDDGLQPLGDARRAREILPWKDNRVELADEKDRHGLPVAKVTFNLHDNDKKLIEFGKNKVMEVMWAAGAQQVVQESRFAHLVGASRMGQRPSTSVVDKFGRTHDIPNLFVCDGSIFPNAGVCQSWPDDPGAGRADSRLPDRPGGRDLVLQPPRSAGTADSLRSQPALHAFQGQSAHCMS